MNDYIIGGLILLVGIALIFYGITGFKKKRIIMPGITGGKLSTQKSIEYTGSWAIAPSIFVISIGILIFALTLASYIGRIFNYELAFPIAVLIWLIATVFCIFFFWIKEKKK